MSETPKTINSMRRDMGYTSDYQDKMNKGMTPKITLDDLKGKMNIKEKSDSVKKFELINEECALLFARKNSDYGNSFDQSLDEDGLVAAKFRIGDKYKRFAHLIKNPADVKDESIRDTLIDMANYAKMTVMWLDARDESEQIRKMNEYMKTPNPETFEEWMEENVVNKPKRDDSLDAVRYAVGDIDDKVIKSGIKKLSTVTLSDGCKICGRGLDE